MTTTVFEGALRRSLGAAPAVSATDPLVTVWEALERSGCVPRGPAHDFRAKCPQHRGDNPTALRVSVGGDGRALLHCHAHQCRAEDIAKAIGVEMCDLFPPGHHRARRRGLADVSRPDFTGRARTVANILAALEKVEAEWHIELRCDCPHCGSPAALVFVSSWGIEYLACPGDAEAEALGYPACTLRQFQEALAARAEDGRAA